MRILVALVLAAALAPAGRALAQEASPLPPPPPQPTLLVTVNVDGAHVRIDEIDIGVSPVRAYPLVAGPHVVRVTRDGYAETQQSIELVEGEQARIDVTLTVLDAEQRAALAAAAAPSGEGAAAAPEWYELWYVWVLGAAGVLVVGGVVAGAVVASQPQAEVVPMGIPLPGLRF